MRTQALHAETKVRGFIIINLLSLVTEEVLKTSAS